MSLSTVGLSSGTVRLASGTQVHYWSGGRQDADTVVLLHGGGVDHALLSWDGVILPLLALGYRVIAPDQPGYGGSPYPQERVTLAFLGRTFAEFLRQLPAVHLCGISMGGAVALQHALNHPETVKSLTLVGSYGLQARAPAHAFSHWLIRMPGLNSLNSMLAHSPALVRLTLRQILRSPQALTPELVQAVQRAMRNRASQAAWTDFQRSEIQHSGVRSVFTQRLPELRVPTLIVHGTADVGVPVQAARNAAQLIPGVEAHFLEGAGHWTQRDQPQEFQRLLFRFLGRHS